MLTRIVVRAFDQDLVRRSSFACGRPELDRWLVERADGRGTLLAVDAATDQIAGYVAAGSYRLVTTPEPDDGVGQTGRSYRPGAGSEVVQAGPARRPEQLSATLVRLAVALDYRGRGVGRLLLVDTLRQLDRNASSLLVVVHAVDEAAADFYRRYGFRRLADHRLTLYLTDRRLRGTTAWRGRPRPRRV